MQQYDFRQFFFLTNTAPPPTGEDVRRTESSLGIIIPDIYKSFLSYTNGANTDFVCFLDLSGIVDQYELLEIKEYLPGYLCIASGNGDYELLMEAEATATTVYLVDAGTMVIDEETITLYSIYSWLLSGNGDDPGDPLGEDDACPDWDDWVDVVLTELPSCGLKGLAHLRKVLKLSVSTAYLYRQSKSLPYILIENIYRGKAERLIRQLAEPNIVMLVDKKKHGK